MITASAGDSDFGVIYPATSPNVVAVGGTSLSTASNSRGWSESVWNTTTGSEGTGSGCSAVEPQPSWQTALGLSGCSKRIDNDVAADADPNTGVAVYDTSNGNGGWNEVGGTSASSPMLAAMYALAGNAGSTPADDIYTHTSDFFDVTSGNNGSCSPAYLCTAETGYDGPTGIGTPDGIAGLVTGGSGTGNTVTVTNPGSQTGTVGTAVSPADPRHRLRLRPDPHLQRHRPARGPVDQLLRPDLRHAHHRGHLERDGDRHRHDRGARLGLLHLDDQHLRWRRRLHQHPAAGQPRVRDRLGRAVDLHGRRHQRERRGRDLPLR